jgi:hypothetical protein
MLNVEQLVSNATISMVAAIKSVDEKDILEKKNFLLILTP